MAGLCVHSALVTGANRGIGLGIVRQLLQMPNPPECVFAACRDPKGERAQVRLSGAGFAEGWKCRTAHTARTALLGPGSYSIWPPSTPTWSSCRLAFLPLLKKAAQGSPGSELSCSKAAIINMSSSAGSIEEVFVWDYGQCIAYRCSKAALNMLTKCQSLGYREHGILCAALHPGWVQTDMGSTAEHKQPTLLWLAHAVHLQASLPRDLLRKTTHI
ncbi:uncharacterized protein [Struthio camelus]|uniref:uncharacterized protein isoform X5 n=1 Tax=Struthio camelus TaxID=8801 RepID=UPI003603C759